MRKEQALKKIELSNEKYLNNDQKLIARGIINSIPEGQDIQGYLDFILKRTGLGFKFDVSPEIANGWISVINEIEEMRINVRTISEEKENKLIIGDNYESLKNLLLTHKGKIDVIYIDPPYNINSAHTDGNESSKVGSSSRFVYKDKFGRNGWLNLMRDRLYLAKKILSDKGIIFISIDDSEQAYLKVLMDDIFGEENFVNQLVWVSNKKGRQISGKMFAKTYEYILVYAKNINTINRFEISKKLAQKLMPSVYENRDEEILKDEYSEFIIQNELHNTNIREFNENTRKNLRFPIYTNGKYFSIVKKEDWKEIWPPRNKDGLGAVWRWQKSKVEQDSFNLYAKSTKNSYKIFTKKRDFVYNTKDIIISSSMTTKSGSSQLESIGITNDIFQFPKPTNLVKFLISFSEKDSIILDFFAGSGTTGQSVMELNREDGGFRKFILCTNNENDIAIKATYERLFRLINGKGTKGETFEWINKNESFKNENLRVFNLKHYDISIDSNENIENLKEIAFDNLKLLSNNYKSKEIDIFYDLSGLNPYNDFQKTEILKDEELIEKVKKWF